MPSVRIFNALVLLKYKPNKLFTLILFSLFLSACGGGGGSEGSAVDNKSSSGSGADTPLALSDKAVISGNVNVSSFTPQAKVGVQGNNINSRSIQSRSMQSRAIKQSSGELKLVPGDITAAIHQHQQDPNAEQPAPVIAPISIELDEDGNYIIEVPAGSDYSLVLINNDGTRGVKLEDIAVGAGETVTHDINNSDLLATGDIRFNVASLASGIALGNVEVSLLDLGTSTTTESDGSGGFDNVPEGSYALVVSRDGFVSKYVSLKVLSGQSTDLQTIELNNQKGSAVGQVNAQDLGNQANLVVYARAADDSLYSAITNASGTFQFPALPVGEGYSFIVTANDFESSKVDNIQIAKGESTALGTIQLQRIASDQGSISGFARFGEKDEAKHAGIIVSVEGTDKEAITSRDGAFVINGLLAGDYTLNYTESNHATVTMESVTVVATVVTNLDAIEMQGFIGSVSGVVELTDGQVLSGAIVSTAYGEVTTDAQGQFTLSGVLIGEQKLTIHKTGYVTQELYVEIAVNSTFSIEDAIQLEPYRFGGSISLGEGIADNSGVQVVLDGLSNLTTITDENGDFGFSGAVSGNYQLIISKQGFSSQSLAITIPENTTNYVLPYSITLNRLEGVVKGVVSLSDQLGHSGVLVEIVGTTFTATTNAVGEWNMKVPVGNYSDGINYTKPYYQSETTSETVTVTDYGDYVSSSVNLTQISSLVSFNASAIGDCPVVNVSLTGTTGIAVAYSANFTVDQQGNLPATELPLGGYTVTVTCGVNGWESYTFDASLGGGVLELEFDAVELRQSFVNINDQDIYTNNYLVTLNIGNTDALEMRIEEGVSDSGWVAFSEFYNHILSAGDGEKTVTIRFRDVLGVELSSVQDSIKLDTSLNVVNFEAAGANSKGGLLHFSLDLNGELDAKVTASVAGLIEGLPLLDNGFGGDTTADDGIYERDYLISTPVDLNQVAIASVIDVAGNTLTVNSAANVVLNTAPEIRNLTSSSNVSSGEMTIRFSTDEPAISELIYSNDIADLNNAVKVSGVFTTSHAITLNGLSANSLTYYRITVADGAENTSQLDGQGKLAPPPVTGLGAYPGNNEVGLIWDVTSNAKGYRIYRSNDGGNAFTLANPEALVANKYYTDELVSNGTEYVYRVTSVDIDNNESEEGVDITVTPNAELAGPTAITGGLIETNTVWLKSRSPYEISAKIKVQAGVELLLLPGTEVSFTQPDVGIHLSGVIKALGTAESNVVINAYEGGAAMDPMMPSQSNYSGALIYDTTNQELSEINHAELNYIKIYYDYSDAWTRNSHLVPLVLNNTKVNGDNAYQPDFYIKSASNSIFNEYGYGASSSEALRVGSVSNVTFNKLNSTGSPEITNSTIAYINNAVSSSFNGAGFYFSNGTIDNSQFNNAKIQDVSTITASTLSNSTVNGNSSLRVTDGTLTNTQVNLSSDYARLTMHYNVLDSVSTVSAKYLDISYNYWGSTNLEAIAIQTGYSPDKTNNTHLYPIITSSLLYEADWDNDSLPDYLDYDNDNDGYSDLQEDWQSDPEFGGILNPLDDQSHPDTPADNDMDGIEDDADIDDDNDGLSDTDELIRLTDPFLSDSDGDGVNDGDEVSYKYNPIDKSNYPLMGNISGKTIDSSNVNTDGVVYVVGYEGMDSMGMPSGMSVSLNNVTVTAGTTLMVEKDTNVTFKDSLINGTSSNVVKIRSTGAGNGSIYLNNTQAYFANIKVALSINGSSNSYIDKSDISITGGRTYFNISNSLININSGWINRGVVINSYLVGGSGFSNEGEIKNSFVTQYFYNYGNVLDSYINSIYVRANSSVINSVIEANFSGEYGVISNSDVRLTSTGLANFFFDNSFIQLGYANSYYSGYGEPVDKNGDGVAETVIEAEYIYDSHMGLMTGTWTVDGINNPRSAPNFPGLVFKPYLEAAPIWSPKGVGAWWDMNNPNTFPDSDPANNMGTIAGQVSLAGYSDHSGVKVEINNTSLWTTTDAVGHWSIRLPAHDYSGGISFTKTHLATVLKNRSYTVEAQTETSVGLIDMEQTTAQVTGVLTIDEGTDYTLASITATKGGQVTTIQASAAGEFEFPSLPLGDYTFDITYPNGSWETVTHELTLVAGLTQYNLPLTRVRNSFVYINGGTTYTNSRDVTLAITNANASNMKVTEGGVQQGVVSYAASSNLTLSAGDGEKAVQVDFTDIIGNPLTPAISSIILDTQLTLSSLDLSPVSTMGETLHIALTANETGGVALVTIPGLVTDLALYDNGLSGDIIADDGVYETDYIITSAEDITTLVTANFVDRAGNTASINSANQLVISTSPTVSELLTQSVDGQLQISFTTNELATAIIQYGTALGNLDQPATISASEVTEHSISLTVPIGQTIYFSITTSDGVTTVTEVESSGVVGNSALTGINISAGNQEIGLVWSEKSGAAGGYRVYRSTDSNHFTVLQDVPADTTYYVDTNVNNDQTYFYRVTWIDDAPKESDQTVSVSATASLSNAGPTELNGGVIAINEIWLKSRSPYIITDNMLIREGATLSLMPGTAIEFNGAKRHIMTLGNIMAYGSEFDWVTISTDPTYIYSASDQSAIIYDTSNQTASEFNFTELNYLKVYYDYTNSYTRRNYLVPLSLIQSRVNGYYNYSPDFYVKSLIDSTFNEYGYGASSNDSLRIGSVVSGIFNKLDNSGNPAITPNNIAYINSAINSTFNGSGFYFNSGSIDNSQFNNSKIEGASSINESDLNDTVITGYSSLRLSNSALTNSQVNLTGDNTRLTMHYNVLDSDSSVRAKLLDISYNYWGSTNLELIAIQTDYSPEPANDTHLYPLITGSLLYQADWDNDGLPDYLDYDNDNDGYSDLQEDWESNPGYGNIYNPLEGASHPVTAADNDMDGLADAGDLDDDNDGLLDADEPTYGTDPFLADSDGDGVNDGDEVSYKYDPLDKSNHPLMGNISGKTIDSGNVNSDGVVYIVGYDGMDSMGMEAGRYVSLSNVTVSPGTALMIEKDTNVTITDSVIEGDAANVIAIRSAGSGNGRLTLNNSRMVYANVKLALPFTANSNSTVDRSDMSFTYGELSGVINNSLIKPNSYFQNYGTIGHSYISGNTYSFNRGTINGSYVNFASELYNYGELTSSYATRVFADSNNSVIGSVVDYFYGNSPSTILDSDVGLASGTRSFFFDNSYIANSAGLAFYNGYGTPVDQLGDGVAETVFTIGSTTYTVDGINNPRSTKNFPNGVDDLWDSAGVGALWNPNAADPTLFPELAP